MKTERFLTRQGHSWPRGSDAHGTASPPRISSLVKAGVSQPDDYLEQVQLDLALKDLVPKYDIDV